jgi:hypothetical protein
MILTLDNLNLALEEIGYGDQSINKKMKDYINLFHSMVSEIHFWKNLSRTQKLEKFSIFLTDFKKLIICLIILSYLMKIYQKKL